MNLLFTTRLIHSARKKMSFRESVNLIRRALTWIDKKKKIGSDKTGSMGDIGYDLKKNSTMKILPAIFCRKSSINNPIRH
jgi:hypothetical protein